MTNNKAKYRQLCKDEKSIPVFSKDWWLDAVCGEGNWDVILIDNKDEIVASFPYYIKNRFSFKLIVMPVLTQKMGPWIKYPEDQNYCDRLSYEKKVMREIINYLPKFDYFHQRFDCKITNWLPFYWSGFKQTTRYTYKINDITDHDYVYSNFKKKLRNEIKKAQMNLCVESEGSLESLYHYFQLMFKEKKQKVPFKFELLRRLDNNCLTHECRKIFVAIDKGKNIHAVLYLVWDDLSAYYLIGCSQPEFRNSGASSLLIWHAIQFASEKVKVFDFEGSMFESIAFYFQSFGAKQTPYFDITKTNHLFKITNILNY